MPYACHSRRPHDPTFFRMISGAKYSGVPHRLCSSSPDAFSFDSPKSVILMCPSASSSRFSGFRSRYTMPLLCRYCRPSAISAA